MTIGRGQHIDLDRHPPTSGDIISLISDIWIDRPGPESRSSYRLQVPISYHTVAVNLPVRIPLLLGSIVVLFCTTIDPAHAQWVHVQSLDGPFYNEVAFASSTLGFITTQTGTVRRTTDGGNSWSTVTLPNAGFSANRDIAFPSATTGYISGDDGIWKTTDGGASFAEITPAGATPVGSASCWFRTASIGIWAYGGCLDTTVTFWRTSDGGSTWASVSDTATPDVAVGGITYQAGTFVVVGGSGKSWTSTDDGATWNRTSTNSAGWQEDLVSRGGRLFIASADGTSCRSSGGGRILVSNDGGSSWATTLFPSVVMWGVSMFSNTDGIAVGDRGAAYRTRDAGATWMLVDCGFDPATRLDDVAMIDATNGFAVGDHVYRWRPDTFALAPDTLDFGFVVVGDLSDPMTARWRSFGTAGQVTGRGIAGSDAASFSLDGNATTPLPLPICGEASSSVRFQPTRTGIQTARLSGTISGKSLDIVLRGTGVKPRLIAAASFRFDSLRCETSVLDSIPLLNRGDYPLTLDSVRIAAGLGRFSIVGPSFPVTVLPGSEARLVLRADNYSIGASRGVVEVFSNDPDDRGSSRRIDVEVFRKPSAPTVPSDTLVITSRAIGTESRHCFFVHNLTDRSIDLTRLFIEGDRDRFSLSYSGPNSIAPRDSVEICIDAVADDTTVSCARLLISSEPCMNVRSLALCYRATEHNLDLPSTLTWTESCGDSIRVDSFDVRVGSDDVLRIDSITIDHPGLNILDPTFPLDVTGGSGRSIRVAHRIGDGPRTDTVLALVHVGDRIDSITIVVSRSASDIEPISDEPVVVGYCDADVIDVEIDVLNIGTQNARIENARLEDFSGSSTIEIGATSIEPGAVERIRLQIPAPPVDRDTALLWISTSCPGDSALIEVIRNRVGPTFRLEPTSIDFGIVVPGEGRDTSILLALVNPELRPTLQLSIERGASLVLADGSTSRRFSLDPEDSVRIEILLEENRGPGQYTDTIVVDSDDPCRRSIRIPVRWEVLSNGPRLSADSDTVRIDCDTETTLSYWLQAPASGPVTIEAIGVHSTSGTVRLLNSLEGASIPSGSSREIRILAAPGSEHRATVDLEIVTDSGDTLRAITIVDRRFSRLRFRDRPAIDVDTLEVTLVDGCTDPVTIAHAIENVGNRADSVIVTNPNGLRSVGPGRFLLEPGESRGLEFSVDPEGAIDGETITIASVECRDTLRIVVEVERIEPAIALDVDTLEFCAGQDTSIVLQYSAMIGSMPGTLEDVRVASTGDPGMQVSTFNNDTLVLALEAMPEGEADLEVTFVLASPCSTEVTVPLLLRRRDCRIGSLSLRVPSITGRWGDTVDVFVELIGAEGPLPTSIGLDLVADNRLVRWVPQESMPGLLSFEINADTLLEDQLPRRIGPFRAEILRGPIVRSDLDLVPVSTTGVFVFNIESGAVLLDDYCDAHDRLLSTDGAIGLRAVYPNPATELITVDLESTIVADQRISMLAVDGALVKEDIVPGAPAGRRLSTLAIEDLPSGLYTLVVQIGRHTFSRSVVVVR